MPGSAPKASFSVLRFAVPNVRTDANLVKVQVQLPDSQPILNVITQAMPGWTITVEKTALAKAKGNITQRVAECHVDRNDRRRATRRVQPVRLRRRSTSPRGKTMTFTALQTYSSGEVVTWSEPVVQGRNSAAVSGPRAHADETEEEFRGERRWRPLTWAARIAHSSLEGAGPLPIRLPVHCCRCDATDRTGQTSHPGRHAHTDPNTHRRRLRLDS